MNLKPYLIAGLFAFGAIAPASAAVTYVDTFNSTGNECSGFGFATCYATTTGVSGDASLGGSPTIYKVASNGQTETGGFASISGNEFSVNYNEKNNRLTFTYSPTAPDPEIHYFAIFQAGSYALFYDLAAPILSGNINLSAYFPNTPGFSHITFFDTKQSVPPVPVPEPASLALFGAGLLGLGLVRRRKNTPAI